MRRTLVEEHAVLEDSENDDEQHSPGPPASVPSDTSNMTFSSADGSDESIDSIGLAPAAVSSPPEPAPARNTPSSRFSTRVDSSNRGALIIDVSDEDSNEAVSPSDSYEDVTADTRATQDPSPLPTSSPIPRDGACHAAGGDAHDTSTVGAGTGDRGCDPVDAARHREPPFVTDGRGRVVWSSPCNAQVEARGARSGSTPTKSTRT